MKKISILYENMQSVKPDEYYRNIIVQPVARKAVTRDSEIQAEDEQSFLAKQLALLQQGGAPIVRTESPMRTPAGVQKTGDRRVQGSPSVQSQLGSPKKMDANKPGAAGSGEGVLANFFNSLLHKKTGAGSPLPKSPNDLSLSNSLSIDKAAVRSDAAAELDRLARKKPPTSSPSQDQNSSEC
ncbi:Cytoplasmic dynein 1 light intermediate chain 1 [Homalodisca vitripennis]|nr:Cytoplasmic dynein 1 light intermediate chain 1 [Homalodisca vitripennis]